MTKNQWKNRIIRSDTVPISDIVPNAKNWRKHPANQQKYVKGSLENDRVRGGCGIPQVAALIYIPAGGYQSFSL